MPLIKKNECIVCRQVKIFIHLFNPPPPLSAEVIHGWSPTGNHLDNPMLNATILPHQIRQQDFPSVTTSMIRYSPKRSDNGMDITCRAVNPSMAGSALEDTVQLRVMCKSSESGFSKTSIVIMTFSQSREHIHSPYLLSTPRLTPPTNGDG